MRKPVISLISDFGWMSQGVGVMKGVALSINPDANIIDITHEVREFNVSDGARTLETCAWLPVGLHVCIVDPGVGTKRKALIILTNRGDYLVGPDNGVLIPAAERFFGGIKKVVEITNEKYMMKPVSPVFHGRDVFIPAAAWLSLGVKMEEFGPEVKKKKLAPAPYGEAKVAEGKVEGVVIHINRFGSLFVNVKAEAVHDQAGMKHGDRVEIEVARKKLKSRYMNTFGEVRKGEAVVLPDDFGRVQVSVNQGNFSKKFGGKEGDKVVIRRV